MLSTKINVLAPIWKSIVGPVNRRKHPLGYPVLLIQSKVLVQYARAFLG